MTKNKKNFNKQLAQGLSHEYSEAFNSIVNVKNHPIANEMLTYLQKKLPMDTEMPIKKYNKIMNKMSRKFGKKLYKSLTKEEKDKLSALKIEFGRDKIEIIEKYQKSKEFWVDEIPNEPEA